MRLLTAMIALIFFSCAQPEAPKTFDNPLPEITPLFKQTAVATGKMNSVADGVDLRQVNLWSSIYHTERKVNTSILGGTPVDIITVEGDYYFVRSKADPTKYGYCMQGFVIKEPVKPVK